MRPLVLSALALAALFSFVNPSSAGWGGSSCAPVGAPRLITAPIWDAPAPVWFETHAADGSPAWAYGTPGNMTRAYCPTTDRYCEWDGRAWVDRPHPVDLPCARSVRSCSCVSGGPCTCHGGCTCPKAEHSEAPLTGVIAEKIGLHGERFTRNSQEIPREQAIRQIGGPRNGNVPDDSQWLRLTVIGAEADRQRVLTDLGQAPELASWKGKLAVQDYAPTDWAVKPGYVTRGQPTIYFQQPDGKVLLRLDQYEGPAKLADSLRKADPSYDPNKDPDGKPKPPPTPAPVVPSLPEGVQSHHCILAGAALAIFLLTRKKGGH